MRDAEAASINARIRSRYLAPEALDGPLGAAIAVVESPERLFLAADL